MESGGDESSVKEMMQKVAAKLEDKWNINKNNEFNEKWNVNTNDVATKLEEKWDAHKNKKLIDQRAPVGGGIAANSEGAGDISQIKEPRNSDTDNSFVSNQAKGVLKSSEPANESDANQTVGSPTADNPYVQRPVPCPQSGLEE